MRRFIDGAAVDGWIRRADGELSVVAGFADVAGIDRVLKPDAEATTLVFSE